MAFFLDYFLYHNICEAFEVFSLLFPFFSLLFSSLLSSLLSSLFPFFYFHFSKILWRIYNLRVTMMKNSTTLMVLFLTIRLVSSWQGKVSISFKSIKKDQRLRKKEEEREERKEEEEEEERE